MRQFIEKKVKNEINNSIEFLSTQKCDTLGVYEKFYKANRKQTKEFLQTKDIEPEEFLENVVFKVIVSLFPV